MTTLLDAIKQTLTDVWNWNPPWLNLELFIGLRTRKIVFGLVPIISFYGLCDYYLNRDWLFALLFFASMIGWIPFSFDVSEKWTE